MIKQKNIILLIESSRSFGRGILKGVAKYSHLHGSWRFYNELGMQKITPKLLKDWQADGAIAQANDASKKADIIPVDIPVVVVAGDKSSIEGTPNIVSDWEMTGHLAAEHLLRCGFKRFAYAGYSEIDWSRHRGDAFAKCIKDAGYQVNFYKPPKRKNYSWGSEENYLLDWLKKLERPIGLFACNDDRGRNILECCSILNINVPEEIAVLSVDNDPLRCDLSDPPLSSISLNTERAGYEAAKLLDQMITGNIVNLNHTITVQAKCVVPRLSTDTLAIEDPVIAQAVRFIRQMKHKQISVDDVANAVMMSRRSLERYFRKNFNCSVLDEIQRVKVEQIARLLVGTNESISKIATDMDFTIKHLSEYFKKIKKMTPTEYRKKYGQP